MEKDQRKWNVKEQLKINLNSKNLVALHLRLLKLILKTK